jgi:signal transduction histidine kinase
MRCQVGYISVNLPSFLQGMDFRAFEATPGIRVIVLPDAPVYTHIAASDDFIRVSGLNRNEVIGNGYFDVLKKTPFKPDCAREQQLRASFAYVMAHKQPHEIPTQRCAVMTQDCALHDRYWKIQHAPLLHEEATLTGIIHTAVDVTEQVQRDQHSKQTIDFLLDNAPVGMVICEAMRDPAGLITDFYPKHINRQYYQLTGFSPEELKTGTLQTILQALGSSPVFSTIVDVVEQGTTLVREQFIARTARWLSVAFARLNDGVQVTLTDITELKKSQLALHQEVIFSRGILNASLNGIYVLTAIREPDGTVSDFSFIQVNQKFAELTGYPVADLPGKSLVELFPHTRSGGLFTKLCQVVNGESITPQVMYHAKSFDRWYDYMVVRLANNDVVVTFQEITRQREFAILVEQQKNMLDSILNHSPNGITLYAAIRDDKGIIQDFRCIVTNQAAETFTQVPREERLRRTVLEIVPDLKESALFRQAVSIMETGEAFQSQYYHTPIDRWLELSIVRMDENHLINVFTDVTTTKQAQLQLEQSIVELKRSNEELKQFAYVASHDLQEPVRKIRMFNSLMAQYAEPGSEMSRYISKVEHSTIRMTGLIKSLLDYSSLSQDRQRFSDVDLNTILENVLSDFEVLITQKQAVIHHDPLPMLEAIPLQMNQLFFNLIGNALKFSRKGIPPIICVKAVPLPEDRKLTFPVLQKHQDYMEITVQDNGIGFNQEYASKIFTIFQQLNDRSLFDGYGIGLGLCKKVADTHKGVIFAAGEPKEGAIFTILLPRKQR